MPEAARRRGSCNLLERNFALLSRFFPCHLHNMELAPLAGKIWHPSRGMAPGILSSSVCHDLWNLRSRCQPLGVPRHNRVAPKKSGRAGVSGGDDLQRQQGPLREPPHRARPSQGPIPLQERDLRSSARTSRHVELWMEGTVQGSTIRRAVGCEKFLTGPAWVVLSKTGPPFSGALHSAVRKDGQRLREFIPRSRILYPRLFGHHSDVVRVTLAFS